MNQVSMRFEKFGMRPPPFTDVVVELEVRNTAPTALWYVLPLYFTPGATAEPLLASAVEVSEFKGRGHVRLARFLGGGSFQLLRVPANGHVRIHGLPITLVDFDPGELRIPVITAARLSIGSTPAENWFRVEMLSAPDADVTFEPGATIASQDTPGAKALPVTLSGDRTETLDVRTR